MLQLKETERATMTQAQFEHFLYLPNARKDALIEIRRNADIILGRVVGQHSSGKLKVSVPNVGTLSFTTPHADHDGDAYGILEILDGDDLTSYVAMQIMEQAPHARKLLSTLTDEQVGAIMRRLYRDTELQDLIERAMPLTQYID